ncbi:MAG: S-adenosyl-l-methionine hydroxide adenosyltransferase family protein [Thermoplasmata archaeon]|nr:S-adenosyl-l-methionine hydroxide adenosyltransferase family protein [Candidatus Sysuiplasma acidicola]MBX8645427.1 S-adenosyl-l-methionine hydroxide adenosyltransferase family protein [Candidatus Sysuiplasma acidicola]
MLFEVRITDNRAASRFHGRPVISLLTDFGTLGGYVGAVKGVILSRTDADIVDISHDISPQSVIEGAFVLKSVVPYFPDGSVHMAVVDPGVGGTRRPIAVKSGKHFFVGPDNGLIIPAAKECGRMSVREIDFRKLDISNVSNTFHGRDVFAPAAAYLSAGGAFEKVGREVRSYREIDIGEVRFIPSGISGICIYADAFGNVITNLNGTRFSRLFSVGQRLKVTCGDFEDVIEFTRTYADKQDGEPLVLIGSHGNIEIAVAGGNAKHLIGYRQGVEIEFRKIRI